MLFDSQKLLTVFTNQAEQKFDSIQEIKDIALNCQRCGLRKNCKKVVFGAGNQQADLMFVGEGPGAAEDRQGIPFVGRAGQLLNRILAAAEIDRDDVYISNIVKCRPPENRIPTQVGIKSCLWILTQEIRFVGPKIIVPLGATAAKALLDPEAKITRIRGKWVKRKNYYFLPTFHPAALLRDENKKPAVWKDFLKIKKAYEKYLKLKAEGKDV
ncbi:uracil-DNA glycosylase family protein [Natroniella sp. ANB-PHB2]|uniref:uracil-DNA glycosylase n=1 Tax=Natroniella sp. ANB-PHB2 TaxID=3384444 RepID=UPI0038D5111D